MLDDPSILHLVMVLASVEGPQAAAKKLEELVTPTTVANMPDEVVEKLIRSLKRAVEISFNDLRAYVLILQGIKMRSEPDGDVVIDHSRSPVHEALAIITRKLLKINRDCDRLIEFINNFIVQGVANESDIADIVPLGNHVRLRSGSMQDVIDDFYEFWRDVSWITGQCKIIMTTQRVLAIASIQPRKSSL